MDKVNEVYYRRAFSKRDQDDLRERIHWICENVRGDYVLDVGCSQGITSILLAREGYNVLGVDINSAAIEYAMNERNKESEHVQNRLNFICSDIANLDPTQKYDTIILGEVLEHVVNPKKLMDKVLALLGSEGRLIITVPFGYLPDPDHKKTYYFTNFLEFLNGCSIFAEQLEIKGNRLAAVCSRSNHSNEVTNVDDLLVQMEMFIQEYMVRTDKDYKYLKNVYEEKVAEYNQIKIKLKQIENPDSEIETENVYKKISELTNALENYMVESNRILEGVKKNRGKLDNIGNTVDELTNHINEKQILITEIENRNQELEQLKYKVQLEKDKYDQERLELENTLRKKYDVLLSKYNELLSKNNKLNNSVLKMETKVKELKETIRYRIGDTIVNSLKRPGLRTLKLPISILRLIREGTKREKQRKNRVTSSTNQTNNTKSGVVQKTAKPQKKNVNIFDKISSLSDHQISKINNSHIKVACILDDFSYNCFKYECELEQLYFNSWESQLDSMNPDFLFVESAWNGVDNSWQFMLVDIQKKQPDCAIKRLVNYCKEKGIKTVFWNKEDPPNYDRFIETARLFDYVFTTEEKVIEKYKTDLGHNHIYVLPFAAQPAIHNPVNSWYSHKENVAFAGTWYGERHMERQYDMEIVLKPALKYGLNIFDRHYNTNSDRYKFPEIYKNNIVGTLDYEKMVKAYKLYKVFLNVNSVKDSPTMFSRRVYEILASGTNVISTPSVGISEQFKELVPIVSSEEEANNYLKLLLNNPQYSQRLSVLGIREVYQKHLYKHRFQSIIETVGISKQVAIQSEIGVTIITCTNRQEFIDNVFENYNNQQYVKKELIVVLNKNDMDFNEWQQKAQLYDNVRVFQCDESMTLGECLNFAIEKSNNAYIAKFDDDDYYSPYYLIDYIHAFEYTDADVIGKGSIYCHIESENALAIRSPRQENKFNNFVFGATLVFKRQIFNSVRFQQKNGGEDSQFLKDCEGNGYKIYSINKYNYTCIRRADKANHTWKMNDIEFLRGCKIVAYTSDYKTHVTI